MRVTYADCTIGNHVYYSRYLDFLEAARGELFRSLGHPFLAWQERGVIFPVLEARLRYHQPARYDDELAVHIEVAALRRAFLTLAYRVERAADGALLLEAETRHVCTSLDEKPRRIPPELADALEPHWRPIAEPLHDPPTEIED